MRTHVIVRNVNNDDNDAINIIVGVVRKRWSAVAAALLLPRFC